MNSKIVSQNKIAIAKELVEGLIAEQKERHLTNRGMGEQLYTPRQFWEMIMKNPAMFPASLIYTGIYNNFPKQRDLLIKLIEAT